MFRFPDELFPKSDWMPQRLVAEYWQSVLLALEAKNIATDEALKGIGRYQEALLEHEALDMVYHDEPERVAEGIVSGGHVPSRAVPASRPRPKSASKPVGPRAVAVKKVKSVARVRKVESA